MNRIVRVPTPSGGVRVWEVLSEHAARLMALEGPQCDTETMVGDVIEITPEQLKLKDQEQ